MLFYNLLEDFQLPIVFYLEANQVLCSFSQPVKVTSQVLSQAAVILPHNHRVLVGFPVFCNKEYFNNPKIHNYMT